MSKSIIKHTKQHSTKKNPNSKNENITKTQRAGSYTPPLSPEEKSKRRLYYVVIHAPGGIRKRWFLHGWGFLRSLKFAKKLSFCYPGLEVRVVRKNFLTQYDRVKMLLISGRPSFRRAVAK